MSTPWVIVSGDFVKTGGMDRANYALAEFVLRNSGSVELVSHRVSAELAGQQGVAIRRAPKPLGSYVLGEPVLDLLGRRAAARVERLGGVSVVNGGNCIAGRVNWVHYVHAAYAPPRSFGPRGARASIYSAVARRRERRALRIAELVVTNSAATRQVVIEELGVPADRAAVVYYGIDAALFAQSDAVRSAEARRRFGWPDRPAVAFVGALGDRRKGFDVAFESWRRLCRSSSWDADLVCVGAGAELEPWRERVRAAGLSERVRLLGFRSDVPEVLGACDAMIAPTRYEAFGLGVLEALAVGLPALVSRAAGVAELYPSELDNLLLDDPESPAELAGKLLAWRQDAARQRERVMSLSERARSRSWDDMASDIVRLVHERGLAGG